MRVVHRHAPASTLPALHKGGAVPAGAHVGPGAERPKEAVELYVSQQVGNLVGTHLRVAKVVLGQKLSRVVELCLEGRALVGQAALEGAAADAELSGRRVGVVGACGQHLLMTFSA